MKLVKVRRVNQDLFDTFSAAMPLKFLTDFGRVMHQLYEEAHSAAYNDPLLEESESEYLTPHYRRALVETHLRKEARAAGLVSASNYNSGKTAQFTSVQAGNFVLTASYVAQPAARTRYAKFRQDHSTLNQLLSQMPIEGVDTTDMLKYNVGTVYCIMLHGSNPFDRSKLGFVDFAFPDHNNKRYVDIFSLGELTAAAELRHSESQTDGAIPVPKRANKDGSGGDQA